MIWKLTDKQVDKTVEKIRQYIDEREGSFIVEVTKHHANRSLDQNAYWWIICMIIGTHLGQTKEAIHKLLNLECNGEIVKLSSGKLKLIPGETHTMTTVEFSSLIEKGRQWALQELGLYINTPEEYREEEYFKIKNEYDKMFY